VNAEERTRLVREVALSGNCSHPIRLRGEMVNLATGEVAESALRVACKDRRRAVCPACSFLYKADAWIMVSAGLIGGKGISELVGTHPRHFVTLTAPSFGSVHTIRADGGCVRRPRSRTQGLAQCVHGQVRFCAVRHDEHDSRLGRPLCVECFDYEGAVLWNAQASKLWNNTVQLIRRSLAEEADLVQTQLRAVAQLNYLKVAEMQRRGLVHFHVVLRADGPKSIDADPPFWLTSELLARVVRNSVARVRATTVSGASQQWGRVLDIRDLAHDVDDARKVASYVAKYSTKTTDGTRDLAYRFHHRRQIENLSRDAHTRQLALTAWDLASRPQLASLNLREHAHAFGFTGQLITKSRHYSTTFGAMRTARAQYMASLNTGEPVAGTFYYEGRGYDDPRGTELAELFFSMQQELRHEALEGRLAPESCS